MPDSAAPLLGQCVMQPAHGRPLRVVALTGIAVSAVIVLCSVLPGVQHQAALASFDAGTLYKFDKKIDLDHPNRIDKYGCLFAGCSGSGGDSLSRKVAKLTRALNMLKGLQAKFDHKLSYPVQTSMTVLPGEPGRMGARGDRGLPGPQGYPGVTGAPGRPGFQGRPGPNGDEGDRGFKGMEGLRGAQGREGVKGVEGPPGIRGMRGNVGPAGLTGPKGYQGDNGPAGQDGQKGGQGKPGSAPAGAPGPDGAEGPRGPTGDRGAEGQRGSPGAPGSPGPQGLAGYPGVDGEPGMDAHRAKSGDCKGTSTTNDENVCCGDSSVDWHNYYSDGSFMDINTAACKFDGTPKYFTSLVGNGYVERINGASSIYSPSQDGFRVYLTQDVTHVTPDGYIANIYRMRIRWCGVGKGNGPTVPNVCCGTGPAEWGDAWHTGLQNVDAKACEMKGDPVWITAAEGAKASGTDKFVGYDSGLGQTYQYSTMYIHKAYASQDYWGYVSGNMFRKGQQDELKPKYCLFGEPFPTGSMLTNLEMIEPDQYPCKGIRIVDQGKITSNDAQMCCGKTDTKWKKQGSFEIFKEVDTSDCNFDKDASNNVVYMTSVGGNNGHWVVSGTTAYMTSSPTGFSMSLGAHPTQLNAAAAEEGGWYVNWCGFGKAGKPSLPKPYIPPPVPNAPPPPPTTKLSTPPAAAGLFDQGKSILNDKCASYRDKRDKTNWDFNEQQKQYAKCMAADCVQSLESSKSKDPWNNPGCRFRDALGFCYAYGSAQKWCSENPSNTYCNDGGENFAAAPLGSATSGKTEWTPHQDVKLRLNGQDIEAGKFDCQCLKNCSCTSKMCWCVDPSQSPTPSKGTHFLEQKSRGFESGSKGGECFCYCGTQDSA